MEGRKERMKDTGLGKWRDEWKRDENLKIEDGAS